MASLEEEDLAALWAELSGDTEKVLETVPGTALAGLDIARAMQGKGLPTYPTIYASWDCNLSAIRQISPGFKIEQRGWPLSRLLKTMNFTVSQAAITVAPDGAWQSLVGEQFYEHLGLELAHYTQPDGRAREAMWRLLDLAKEGFLPDPANLTKCINAVVLQPGQLRDILEETF